MNNNDIFKKLRVALQLRDDQIQEIMQLVDFRISLGEIGNFFRNPDHPKYVECGDQVLRNFLNGLVLHLRGTKESPKDPKVVLQGIRAEIRQPAKGVAPKKEVSTKATPKAPAKKSGPQKKASPVEKVKYTLGKKKS